MIDVMDNLSKLLYVAERDIDLLLLEELNVCRDFASWFLRQVRQQSDDVTPLRGAWHSVTDAELGESDLIVLYDDDFAILVENKIDAPAQPEQGQRYKLRGSKGQEKGDWKDYLTCIVAPRRYLEINAETQHYDSTLSYESIRQWFKALGTSRGDYRSQMIDSAGKSAAVRFEVRPVDRFGSFEAQQDHVILALEAASKLYTIAEGMRNDI